MGALSREQEPPVGTWVKDRHGGTAVRHPGGGWAPPGAEPFGRWEAMWDARGPLVECGPWGRPLPGEKVSAEDEASALPEGVVIEQSVRVWLRWDVDSAAWVVDAPTFDGYPLEPGYDDHDVHVEGFDEPGVVPPEQGAAVEAARQAAQAADLPTGEEIARLLLDAMDEDAALRVVQHAVTYHGLPAVTSETLDPREADRLPTMVSEEEAQEAHEAVGRALAAIEDGEALGPARMALYRAREIIALILSDIGRAAGVCVVCGSSSDHDEPHGPDCIYHRVERALEAVETAEEAAEVIASSTGPAARGAVAALASAIRGILAPEEGQR